MKNIKTVVAVVLAAILVISSVSVSCAEASPGREENDRLNLDPINITPSSVSISKGQSYQMNAILGPDYTGAEISWNSSNTSVATVRNGLVTGLSSGTATITATINYAVPEGQSNYDTCLVTVSSTGIISNGTYFIENVNAGKYIDVEGPSTSNGAKMQLWELTGDSQRKWTVSLGSDGYYRIQSNYSNKYMRVTGSSSTAGATITQNSSIVSGSKWSFMITSAGNYAIIPACSGTTLIVLNAPGTSNGYDLNTEVYTKNSDYKDEWTLTRMLPTNGSEIAYNASDWTSVPSNCYQYVLNCQAKPWDPVQPWLYAQPGDYSHQSISGFGQNPSLITDAVTEDYNCYNDDFGTSKYFGAVQKYALCNSGCYKVALVIGPKTTGGYDYHWYRQDADGLWSHKRGSNSPTRTDAADKLIIDPETASRNYSNCNYSTFVGFFQLTPWNHMITNGSYSFNIDEMSEREAAILILTSKGAVSLSGRAVFELSLGDSDFLVFDCELMEGYKVVNGVRSEITLNDLIGGNK